MGLICHGGAGIIEDKQVAADGLRAAIEEGYRLLRASANALETVTAAVQVMEDSGLFNCGAGSDLTCDGQVEMDAAVMTQDGRFGAVCSVAGLRNPVLLALAVMEQTDHLLLSGEGAAKLGRELGLVEHAGPSDRARRRLESVLASGSKYFPKLNRRLGIGAEKPETRNPNDETGTGPSGIGSRQPEIPPGGTVGAVAIDKHGNLAAATSSGGVAGRMGGRVGDTAVIGAGTFAAPAGAASFTGHGEEIMRRMMAKDLVDRMATLPGSVAMTLVIAEARRKKVACGAVGMDARGGFCYGHTTPDMAWGYKVADRLFLFTEEKKKR
jgi:beta-aspartyl-peptidase (threonine type)